MTPTHSPKLPFSFSPPYILVISTSTSLSLPLILIYSIFVIIIVFTASACTLTSSFSLSTPPPFPLSSLTCSLALSLSSPLSTCFSVPLLSHFLYFYIFEITWSNKYCINLFLSKCDLIIFLMYFRLHVHTTSHVHMCACNIKWNA